MIFIFMFAVRKKCSELLVLAEDDNKSVCFTFGSTD